MLRIHQLIDDETGEVVAYRPDLAPRVHEFRELMRGVVKMQARRDLATLQPQRQLKPAPPPSEAEAALFVADFFQKVLE